MNFFEDLKLIYYNKLKMYPYNIFRYYYNENDYFSSNVKREVKLMMCMKDLYEAEIKEERGERKNKYTVEGKNDHFEFRLLTRFFLYNMVLRDLIRSNYNVFDIYYYFIERTYKKVLEVLDKEEKKCIEIFNRLRNSKDSLRILLSKRNYKGRYEKREGGRVYYYYGVYFYIEFDGYKAVIEIKLVCENGKIINRDWVFITLLDRYQEEKENLEYNVIKMGNDFKDGLIRIIEENKINISDEKIKKIIMFINNDGINNFKDVMEDGKKRVIRIIKKKKKMESSDVQSILFDRKKYDIRSAKSWLKRNKFKGLDVDKKVNYLRFRQKNPKNYKRFITKEIKRGIKFIIGYK